MIDTAFITSDDRVRETDEERVSALVASIEEVGLLNPITVYRKTIIRAGQEVDGYGLVAGAHRLRAFKRLNRREIPATVVDLDDPRRVIAECDENLCGARLTPSEVALFTARRKTAYETIHGPAKANGANASNAAQGNAHDANEKSSFASDTAAMTGNSERKVQIDASRGEAITEVALALVKGTGLDTGVYLDELKKVDPDKQEDTVRRDLAERKTRRSSQTPDDGKKRSAGIDADVAEQAAQEFAEMVVRHFPAEALDAARAALFTAKANGVAKALVNLLGGSVMDKGDWK